MYRRVAWMTEYLPLQHLADLLHYGGGRRSVSQPQIRVIGDRCISAIQALRRRVEQMEPFAGHPGDNLSVNASPRPTFAHTQEMTGSGHRLQNGFGVDWSDGSKVDNFDIDPLLLELGGCG